MTDDRFTIQSEGNFSVVVARDELLVALDVLLSVGAGFWECSVTQWMTVQCSGEILLVQAGRTK